MSRQQNTPQDDLGRVTGILGNASVWADPPGSIEPALLLAIGETEVTRPPVAGERRRSAGRAAAVGLIAVAALVAVFMFGPQGGSQPESDNTFALSGTTESPGAGGTASVGPAEAGWWIRLDLSGLAPAPAGSYYEGWVSDGRRQVSVGTFHMRATGTVGLWSGVPMAEYPELLVTLQEEGSGPAPSGIVVLTGHLVADSD